MEKEDRRSKRREGGGGKKRGEREKRRIRRNVISNPDLFRTPPSYLQLIKGRNKKARTPSISFFYLIFFLPS